MLWATHGCKSSKAVETPLKWDLQRDKEQTGDPFSVGAGSLQLLLTTSPGTPGLDPDTLTCPQLTDRKHAHCHRPSVSHTTVKPIWVTAHLS